MTINQFADVTEPLIAHFEKLTAGFTDEQFQFPDFFVMVVSIRPYSLMDKTGDF